VFSRVTVGVAAILLATAWLLAYGPSVPGGFIKDDFRWVINSRIDGWPSVAAAFTRADDFYRPIVQLSFGITDAIFGINPIPYALTNIALALACAASIHALTLAAGLPSSGALVAAATWAFNFHGINMAVVWLSGRTSLLGTLFATLCALAFARGRPLAAGLLCFAALLSKEEVIALPAIVSLWAVIDKTTLRRTLPLWAALALYLLLRARSGAVGIDNAPPFYQFTTEVSAIAKNLAEYADRAMTFGALVMLAAIVWLGRRPVLGPRDRRLIVKGAVWLVGGFALTLWLPVRSGLYAVFPSVGLALIAAVVVSAAAAQAPPARAMRLAAAALVLPFLLLPVYWSRNVRWSELRELSNDTFQAISMEPLTDGMLVVLEDDLSTRRNFRNAIGTLYPQAAAMHFGNRVALWIEPPSPEAAPNMQRPAADRVVTFRLIDGRIQRQ
jgi:hypothetical protein